MSASNGFIIRPNHDDSIPVAEIENDIDLSGMKWNARREQSQAHRTRQLEQTKKKNCKQL